MDLADDGIQTKKSTGNDSNSVPVAANESAKIQTKTKRKRNEIDSPDIVDISDGEFAKGLGDKSTPATRTRTYADKPNFSTNLTEKVKNPRKNRHSRVIQSGSESEADDEADEDVDEGENIQGVDDWKSSRKKDRDNPFKVAAEAEKTSVSILSAQPVPSKYLRTNSSNEPPPKLSSRARRLLLLPKEREAKIRRSIQHPPDSLARQHSTVSWRRRRRKLLRTVMAAARIVGIRIKSTDTRLLHSRWIWKGSLGRERRERM
jgi:hypothetical protein